MVGVATSNGVEVPARQAYELGFKVTLATDAVTDLHADALTYSIFRRRFSRERRSAFRQRHDGAALSEPVRQTGGKGLSSSTVNGLWGFANVVVAYLLIGRVGNFDLRASDNVIASGVGVLLIGVVSARLFGRFHGGNSPVGS